MALLNHSFCLFTSGRQGVTRLRVAKLSCQVIEHAAGWDDVPVAVSVDDVADGDHRLIELLLLPESPVRIAADLLSLLVSLFDHASRLARRLIEEGICLCLNLLGSLT